MPVTKSAIKKLRQDRAREARNRTQIARVKQAIKKVKKQKTQKALEVAFSLIDKAAKKNVLHKNKAAKLKSHLTKLVAMKTAISTKKTAKKRVSWTSHTKRTTSPKKTKK